MKNSFIMAVLVFGVFSTAFAGASCGHRHDHGAHEHSFKDIKKYERMFEAPERDARQKPKLVIREMQLKPGMVVADIGAGTGYFARRFARSVGSKGLVVAYDVEPVMTAHINKTAGKLGLKNLRGEKIDPRKPTLPRRRYDVIFLCNVYHHIAGREQYFQRLINGLKLGGRLIIVDFKKDAKVKRPPRKWRVENKRAMAELKTAGYDCKINTKLLPDQYYLECRPRLMRKVFP